MSKQEHGHERGPEIEYSDIIEYSIEYTFECSDVHTKQCK